MAEAAIHGPGVRTLQVGGEIHQLEASTFACLPPGVMHTFSNTSVRAVRFLNFNTPAGWEHYMRDLGEAAKAGPLTAQAIGQIASRYDFEVVR